MINRKPNFKRRGGIRLKNKLHTIKRGKTRHKRPQRVTGTKIWSLKKADTEFSIRIRNRDGNCMFPNCQVTDFKKLQASHYHGRATKSVRFDFDNVVALCWLHHFKDKLLGFEFQKQTKEKHGYDGPYTLWMRNWLGEERFNALNERAKISIKQNKAIEQFQALYQEG